MGDPKGVLGAKTDCFPMVGSALLFKSSATLPTCWALAPKPIISKGRC